MIISASGRTDIPAYYSEWFLNRVRAGTLLVRNPYYPELITRYDLKAEVVDAVIFCTKNPAPIVPFVQEMRPLNPYFYVTITPYGTDIEPGVPDRADVAASTIELSRILGRKAMGWRYDPIIINSRYTIATHIGVFTELCRLLRDSVSSCVVSFLQLYGKTTRNFPEGIAPSPSERRELLQAFVPIASDNGIILRTCADYEGTAIPGLGKAGCITRETIRSYIGMEIPPLSGGPKRQGCHCNLPSRDIGAYNTCPHGCRYCYANYDMDLVMRNYRGHNPRSPLLSGELTGEDTITEAKQESFRQGQLSFDLFD